MNHFFLTIIGFISFISCVPIGEKDVSSALELAGANRPELQKVLDHYSAPGDSLKLRAAEYLIGNMTGKNTQTSGEALAYRELFPELAKISPDEGLGSPRIKMLVEEFRKIHPQTADRQLRAIPDLQNIRADYLIENIDASFDVWEKSPWSKNYTFEQFCEYILPYRSMTESLSDWKTDGYKKPLWWHEGYDTIKDPVVLCDSLQRKIDLTFEDAMGFYPVPQSYPDLLTSHWGYCLDETNYAVFQMRANGVPVAVDFVPHWASLQNRHYWNVVIDTNGYDHILQVGWARSPGEVYLRQKFAKIFRYTYTIQKNSIVYKRLGKEDIPEVFRNCDIKDVTVRYGVPVTDIEIALNDIPKNTKIAYLCVSSRDMWTPVDYAEIKGGKAVFKDVSVGIVDNEEFNTQEKGLGKGLVLLVGYYVDGKIVPGNNLFHLNHEGRVSYLVPDTSIRRSVTLKRKVRKRHAFEIFADNMIGTRFEGANRPDFSDAVTLATIEGPVYSHMQSLSFNKPGKYRYVRYVSNNGKTPMIGELQFRDDKDTELIGNVIGTKEKRYFRPKELAFDGNIVTYYEPSMSDSWIGLDLGKPVRIATLSFCPRTDGNDVEIGDEYSLCYWDNEWITLARRKATDHAISFGNVPSNAMLLLRNHTKGKEERIFTYENDRQIWW